MVVHKFALLYKFLSIFINGTISFEKKTLSCLITYGLKLAPENQGLWGFNGPVRNFDIICDGTGYMFQYVSQFSCILVIILARNLEAHTKPRNDI